MTDSILCPECGLGYHLERNGSDTGWICRRCGFSHPDSPQVVVKGDGSMPDADPLMDEARKIIEGEPEQYQYQTEKLDWVIMGCESGPSARPMSLDWARSMRDQCQAAGVSFFFKQAVIDGKLTKLPMLDGKQWAEYPK